MNDIFVLEIVEGFDCSICGFDIDSDEQKHIDIIAVPRSIEEAVV